MMMCKCTKKLAKCQRISHEAQKYPHFAYAQGGEVRIVEERLSRVVEILSEMVYVV